MLLVMMYIVGHVIGLQHLLEVAAELVMVIVKHITNCLSNIVNYKFGNLYIYCNYYKLYNYHKLYICHNNHLYR